MKSLINKVIIEKHRYRSQNKAYLYALFCDRLIEVTTKAY